MNNIVRNLLGFTLLLLINSHAMSETQIASVYTDLSSNGCKPLKMDKETGNSIRKCPGVGGFHLLVLDDDARASITVVGPNNKEYPLDYWNVVTRSFSSLGRKAEWRVRVRQGQAIPVALIVRIHASEQDNPESPRKTSYLAVTKITPEQVCVIDKIEAGINANERARQIADNSANKECLKP